MTKLPSYYSDLANLRTVTGVCLIKKSLNAIITFKL